MSDPMRGVTITEGVKADNAVRDFILAFDDYYAKVGAWRMSCQMLRRVNGNEVLRQEAERAEIHMDAMRSRLVVEPELANA